MNKASIWFKEECRQFHLTNWNFLYLSVYEDGKLCSFTRSGGTRAGLFLSGGAQHRPMTTYRKEGDLRYSLEHVRQEFPEYGTTDFRHPAICLRQENGLAYY